MTWSCRCIIPFVLLCAVGSWLAGCANPGPEPISGPHEVPHRDAEMLAVSPAAAFIAEDEIIRLRAAMAREVPQQTPDALRDDQAWIERAGAMIARSNTVIDHPQLIVAVDRAPSAQPVDRAPSAQQGDRAPSAQQMVVMVAQPGGRWAVIGGTKVSTGQAGRRRYFITPTGVFVHGTGILDYRALGTFNENHIRGLGVKGMRVWDFGWHPAARGWTHDGTTVDIRLLMHATDPAKLESRLGRPASKGCIRIPATMNQYLDRHGVLDADQERAAVLDARFRAVLRPDRDPTPLAGDLLVVVDSSAPN